MQNYFIEAGIGDQSWHLRVATGPGPADGRDRHWGWETPGSQLRGHFLGHWLSAAAREVAATGDRELSARLQDCLDELERCQVANGGEWIWAISPRYLDRLAAGLPIWAPQYGMHKTLMGLVDVYRDLADERALRMVTSAAAWIDRWSSSFSTSQFQAILDVETGGMLEVWADLLEITGDSMYERLLDRYWRHEFFDAVRAGHDVLTNMHANTQIPEVLGAARAYEVTGEDRWKEVVTTFWRLAVVERGTYCTGGQTAGEIWTPPFEYAARRGDKNQEHCVVYNMIRLADLLFQWTGDVAYLDYIERNLYNGILAQQDPRTGMVAYFLPLEGGAQKHWGTPTDDFWCCHGTLVQAHTRHSALPYYLADDGAIVIAQYIPSRLITEVDGAPIDVTVELRDTVLRAGPDANAGVAGSRHRPNSWGAVVTVTVQRPTTLRFRIPAWVSGQAVIDSDSGRHRVSAGFADVRVEQGTTRVELTLPTKLHAEPIPDEPSTVAFLDGPIVLAGVIESEFSLFAGAERAEAVLVPDNERQWSQWLPGYRATGQDRSIRFQPLFTVTDERYSVYFPVRELTARTV
jgi:DUF1680 family protein